MRKLTQLLLLIVPVLLAFLLAAPVAVFAADEADSHDTTEVADDGHGDGHADDGHGTPAAGDGSGFVLGGLAFIFGLLMVIVVIGAAGLGVIGLGYWQSSGG